MNPRYFYALSLGAILAPVSLLADSSSIRAPLHGAADADAVGIVRATLREKKSELIVSARNLAPARTFDIEIGGIIEGTLTTDAGGRANIRFRTPARRTDEALDFDPRGKTLRILDNGTSVLQGIVSGNGEDDGTIVTEHAELSREDAPATSSANVAFAVSKSGRRTFRLRFRALPPAR